MPPRVRSSADLQRLRRCVLRCEVAYVYLAYWLFLSCFFSTSCSGLLGKITCGSYQGALQGLNAHGSPFRLGCPCCRGRDCGIKTSKSKHTSNSGTAQHLVYTPTWTFGSGSCCRKASVCEFGRLRTTCMRMCGVHVHVCGGLMRLCRSTSECAWVTSRQRVAKTRQEEMLHVIVGSCI